MVSPLPSQLDRAGEYWAAGQVGAAIAMVRDALDTAPDDVRARALMVRLLNHHPEAVLPEMTSLLIRLLRDPHIGPDFLGRAGWALQRSRLELQAAGDIRDPENLTRQFDGDELTLTLLQESPVGDCVAETILSSLRRWMLISGRWRNFPSFVDALGVQTTLNGGAWPFDQEEQDLLNTMPGTAIDRTYIPSIHRGSIGQPAESPDARNETARAVARQYEGWPYPSWRRITTPVAWTLPALIRKMDPGIAEGLSPGAEILVAGCGTGREAAYVSLRFPDACVTAIDISGASLAYARSQWATPGMRPVRFAQLDLHDVAELGKTFDAIFCCGVLHHLADPEAGLAALSDVLRPGGVMKLMLYSRLGRLGVVGARRLFPDLLELPVDASLLRRVRHRLMTSRNPPAPMDVLIARDFSTLAGTHDLLLHRHEDAFDIPRIRRALDRTGLGLLTFVLPTPAQRARYDALFPEDPMHRDFRTWNRFEFLHPTAFAAMYEFWCFKPRA